MQASLRQRPIYTVAEIRELERAALSMEPVPPLMERAGLAAAELARERFLGAGRSALVLAGPGNNGGDGFVLARQLRQWWYRVTVVFTGDRDKLSDDARAALDAWLAAGGRIEAEVPRSIVFDLVVDALFGIGLERDITGRYAELIGYVNDQPAPVLALDIPSGLQADHGRILGCGVRADCTLTFIALKPGLLTLDGPDQAGEVQVAELGLDVEALLPARGRLISPNILACALLPRPRNSHKGTFGNVGVIGGAYGMTGAALLAGRAALKLGAGRVYLGLLGADSPRLDPVQPELMLRTAEQALELNHQTCLVVGPGLGQSAEARDVVRTALHREIPLVLDADALNLIGTDAELQQHCRRRTAPTLMTPHPAEAGRLLQTPTARVQADRLGAALQLAPRYRAAIALKGVGTVCALPDGRWYVNPSGNPGMGSAGMGDVLSGILGALLAQGATDDLALLAGVCLHGAAADQVLNLTGGPIGMTASEVIDAARSLLNRAIYGAPPA
jgi:hydroxyethylthiazole kinase-like uncharacterized protein yjeF